VGRDDTGETAGQASDEFGAVLVKGSATVLARRPVVRWKVSDSRRSLVGRNTHPRRRPNGGFARSAVGRPAV